MSFAVSCYGGGYINVSLNGEDVTTTHCASTVSANVVSAIVAGASFKAPQTLDTLAIYPGPGQHWYAAMSAGESIST